jgi:hypothetical protein
MPLDSDKVFRVSRFGISEETESEKKKKPSPSILREAALGRIADRLGESKSWDQKANNAFVYYSLPTFTSLGMAFEKRMQELVNTVNATITDCSCKVDFGKTCDKHPGRSVIIEGGLFENTFTMTEWFTNFFQQSPSINARARDDQVEIAKAGYSVQTTHGFQTTPTKIDLNE